MAMQKQRAAAQKPVLSLSKGTSKSRRGGKTKTNFKTRTKENASSARAGSRESQTIIKLIGANWRETAKRNGLCYFERLAQIGFDVSRILDVEKGRRGSLQ